MLTALTALTAVSPFAHKTRSHLAGCHFWRTWKWCQRCQRCQHSDLLVDTYMFDGYTTGTDEEIIGKTDVFELKKNQASADPPFFEGVFDTQGRCHDERYGALDLPAIRRFGTSSEGAMRESRLFQADLQKAEGCGFWGRASTEGVSELPTPRRGL